MIKDFFVFKNWSDVNIFCTVTLFLIISSCAVNAYQPIVTIGKPYLSDIQYAPNGLFLATLTSFVELLDTKTFEPISKIYTPFYVDKIIISPDSSLIAGYGGSGIYVYDVSSKELIMNAKHYVGAAEFSPDGKYLAYSKGDSIIFWDIELKKTTKELSGDPEPLFNVELYSIQSIAFHPSGNLLAVGSCRKTIALWNTETGRIESYLNKGDDQSPFMMAFSNDGTLLAVLCNKSVRLFNILDGSWYYTPGNGVNSIAFTNDNNYLIIGESRGDLGIYSIKARRYEKKQFFTRQIPASMGFCLIDKITTSPDGQKFVTLLNGSRIVEWDTKNFSKIKTIYGWNVLWDAVYLPKINRIITGTYSSVLCFWDATTGKLLKAIEFYYDVECMTVSPDGKYVAVCAEETDRIYDGSTGREIYRFTDRKGHTRVMAYSPSGRYLASNGWKGTYIYDTKTGNTIKYISNEWVDEAILLFTHDEKKIVILPREKYATEFWDIETGKLAYEKPYQGPLIRYGNDFMQAKDKGYGIEILMLNSRKVISYIDAQMPKWYWDKVFHPSGNIISIMTFQEDNKSWCDFYNTWTGKKIGSISNINFAYFAGNEHIFVVNEKGLELYRISDILGVNPKDLRFEMQTTQLGRIKSELMPNYPNPFNPGTWIPYYLAESAYIKIKIHSMTGKLIRTLNLGHKEAGLYSDKDKAEYWDGKDNYGDPVGSGLYFYTIYADDFVATRKMILLK